MKPFSLISISTLIFFLGACAADSQAGVSVDFETIQFGVIPVTGVSGNRKIEFIDNQISFDDAVSNYSNAPADQIDFSAHQVVLLTMGEKPTGGYGIRIDSVEETNGTLKLGATETGPGSNCMVTQALTAPYLFVKVSSVKRVETVVIKSEVVDCSAP